MYRGEGNANLVVAVRGTGEVLRLQKSKEFGSDHQQILLSISRYMNYVLLPIFPSNISPVSVRQLDASQLELIRRAIDNKRPEKRLSKNIFCPAALVMKDHCFMEQPSSSPHPVLAVEIKPKQGFISNQYLKESICNFCLKQEFKYQSEGIEKTSYCPLDLYSGDEGRMSKAINNLLNFPKNNLKIFKDGIILHQESSARNAECQEFLSVLFGDQSLLTPVLVKILLGQRDFACCNGETDSGQKQSLDNMKEVKCSRNQSNISQSTNLLSEILKVQRQSIEDVEAEDILHRLLDEGKDLETLQDIVSGGEIVESDYSKEQIQRIEKLKKFALAVTAKDLSIIVTIAKEEKKDLSKEGEWMLVNQQHFRFKLSLIDLDPKSLTRISKYVQKKKKWGSLVIRSL